MPDVQYADLKFRLSEIEHRYGDAVHVISNPFLLSHLLTVCDRHSTQPTVNRLITILYQELIHTVMNQEFGRRRVRVETRMAEHTPLGVYEGQTLDRSTRAVTVNLARAGTLPSQVCFDALNEVLEPDGVRQDHFLVARTMDAADRVTGSSMCAALKTYKEQVAGTPRKLITMHLIVTPEYLRRLRDEHPDVAVYALRLDRGMSSEEVLATVPGTRWAEERGLSDRGYIVPGAGGLGEVMNNSWV